jgi:hypothetical protein
MQRRGVKEVKQAIIAGIGETQAADQAGDASQVRTQAQGGQDEHHP